MTHRTKLHVTLLLCFGGLLGPATASAFDLNGMWSTLPASGTGPGPRNQHGAVYDPIGNRMILFGGAEALGDTWSLSLGTTPRWSPLVAPSLPTGRKAMALVYDPVRHRVILFGGYSNNYENDTWVLSLSGTPAWTELPAVGVRPSPRMFSTAVYDPRRDRMLVFGGHPEQLNDVWELDLQTQIWSELQALGPLPSPRWGHMAVYDPVGDRLVIFGGTTGADEVWALSLVGTPKWTRLTPNGGPPAPRYCGSAIYDEINNRMVVYGGSSDGVLLTDVWALYPYPSPLWVELTPSGVIPAARWLHSAVYQSGADRMIVYGPTNVISALTWSSPMSGPRVSFYYPVAGSVGDSVKVYGGGLEAAESIDFNGPPAVIASNTPYLIATTVPVGATTGPITVTTALGTFSTSDSFFVGERPQLASATPSSGKIGTAVMIRGAHFTGAERVAFGDSSDAAFVVLADSLLSAVVDSAGRTGRIAVTTPVGTGTSDFEFAVIPPDTAARIASVRDVPNDQGGFVSVRWLKSDYDAFPQRWITGYRVWRRAPVSGPHDEIARAQPAWLREQTADGAVVFWEPLATVPASYLPGYAFTAPTTQDSIGGSNPFTAFLVQTLTSDPFVFFGSPTDSGYSVDNLAPPAPTPFVAQYSADGVALHWAPSRAPDLGVYRLHRGTSTGFVPSEANLVTARPDTGFFDVSGGPGYIYKLAAVDVHGNVGRYAVVSASLPTAALASFVASELGDGVIRMRWYLSADEEMALTVYRRGVSDDWRALGTVRPDGLGYVTFEDRELSSAMRYGYRLGLRDQRGVETFAGEAWVETPATEADLAVRIRNPVIGGEVTISFAPPAGSTVHVALFDVTGRKVAGRDVVGGAGRQSFGLAAADALSPGVYLVRVGLESPLVARVVVVR